MSGDCLLMGLISLVLVERSFIIFCSGKPCVDVWPVWHADDGEAQEHGGEAVAAVWVASPGAWPSRRKQDMCAGRTSHIAVSGCDVNAGVWARNQWMHLPSWQT